MLFQIMKIAHRINSSVLYIIIYCTLKIPDTEQPHLKVSFDFHKIIQDKCLVYISQLHLS